MAAYAPNMPDLAPPTSGGPGEKSVLVRGLEVLACFEGQHTVQGISAIAKRTGLPVATVHRLIATLVEWGAVERISRGRYRLGLKMWRLGAAVPQARTLRDVALPYLEDLYEATHEVVHLAVLDGHQTLYVEKISGRGAVAVTSRVGRRLPLHATGPGKVLLAFGPQQLFEEVTRAGLARRSANTITDPDELRRALAEIRRVGFAISRNEASTGTASVASPVFDASAEVIASVSVVTPMGGFDPLALIPAVCAVGRAISRQMGAPADVIRTQRLRAQQPVHPA